MNPNRMRRWLFVAVAAAFAAVTAHADVAPPRCGVLQIVDSDHLPINVCPLDHTDVRADISGFIARVTLTQKFRNPTGAPIEAVYVFPMSGRAAVDRMFAAIAAERGREEKTRKEAEARAKSAEEEEARRRDAEAAAAKAAAEAAAAAEAERREIAAMLAASAPPAPAP